MTNTLQFSETMKEQIIVIFFFQINFIVRLFDEYTKNN